MKYLEEQVNYWKRTIDYGDEVVNVSVIKQHLQSVKDRLKDLTDQLNTKLSKSGEVKDND